MKKYFLPSLRMTLVFLVLLAVVYPLLVAGIAKLSPGGGRGETILVNGKVVGYTNVGQKFTYEKYFQGRPSAVDFNAAGSGGSNKAPDNPDYLKQVQDRIDTFLAHNPGIHKADIPSELVTASGSGLDPDISPIGASVQAKRIAVVRNIDQHSIDKMIAAHTEKPLLGFLGPSKVNVLKLNIALDELSINGKNRASPHKN